MDVTRFVVSGHHFAVARTSYCLQVSRVKTMGSQVEDHTMSYQWGPMREPTGQFEVVASCGNDLLHGARGRVTGGVGCVSGEFSPPAHKLHATPAHAQCRDAPMHRIFGRFSFCSGGSILLLVSL